VEELLPQARAEAWRWFQRAPQQLELDELVSLGAHGLAMAGARWETYCAEHGYDPGRLEYFPPYALRRMRGSILDYMRSVDWVTRSTRGKAKRLREAGQDLGATEAQLTAETGLDARQIRDTMAAVARRPVSMDAEPVEVTDAADVEGQAVVNAVTGKLVEAMCAQPPLVQAVLALHYHQGLGFREIAELLSVTEPEITSANQAGLLAVHTAMVSAASDKA
jgi:RNA polymerase sigma factor FliA